VPIGLNYRGAGQHKTHVGASVTILFNAFMIWFACQRIIKWVEMREPKFSPVTIPTDLHDVGEINISEK
jgi:hypothetical protein